MSQSVARSYGRSRGGEVRVGRSRGGFRGAGPWGIEYRTGRCGSNERPEAIRGGKARPQGWRRGGPRFQQWRGDLDSMLCSPWATGRALCVFLLEWQRSGRQQCLPLRVNRPSVARPSVRFTHQLGRRAMQKAVHRDRPPRSPVPDSAFRPKQNLKPTRPRGTQKLALSAPDLARLSGVPHT